MWSEWHQLSVYGVQPTMPFPPSIPSTSDTALPMGELIARAHETVPAQQTHPGGGAWDLFEDFCHEDYIVGRALGESSEGIGRSDTSSLTSDIDTCESLTDGLPGDGEFGVIDYTWKHVSYRRPPMYFLVNFAPIRNAFFGWKFVRGQCARS